MVRFPAKHRTRIFAYLRKHTVMRVPCLVLGVIARAAF